MTQGWVARTLWTTWRPSQCTMDRFFAQFERHLGQRVIRRTELGLYAVFGAGLMERIPA